MPAKSEFPGTGVKGNGISERIESQAEWTMRLRTEGCLGCHLMGTKATREISKGLGLFPSTKDVWDFTGCSPGQNGGNMSNQLNDLGRPRALTMLTSSTPVGGQDC